MQYVFVTLILLAFYITQSLIGGAKIVFAIPGYVLLGIAGLLSLIVAFRKARMGARPLAVFATILLAGYVVWRALTSPIQGLALTDLLMVLGALCVYLLMALHVESPKARLWLLVGCFLLGFLHVVAEVFQFRYGEDFMFLSHLPDTFPLPQIFRGSGGWRASGFYICANHAAGFLESLCGFAIAYCCWGKFSAMGRIALAYVVAFCLVGIALTGSRGGYLSTGLGLGAFVVISLWFLKRLRSNRLGVMMIGAVILGVIVIGGAAYGMSRNATIGNRMSEIRYDEAGQLRPDMWQAALKQYKLSPVIGTGAGTYLYYGRQLRTPNVQRDPIHAHCDYLELLSEYGIVGCVLMGFFLATHIHAGISGASNILKNRLRATGRSSSNELALIAGAGVTVVALMAHSVVDFNFHLPANALFFAVAFGILACPTTDPKLMVAKETPRFVRAACFILPVASVFLIVKSVNAFRGEYSTEWARVHLRNKLFVDSLASFQTSVSWGLAPMAAGIVPAASGEEMEWARHYQTEYLFPLTISEAEKGIKNSPLNVDAPYYLGESLHFMGVYESSPVKRRDYYESAVKSFEAGKKLFPQESRFNLKLARTLVNLGRLPEAEAEVLKVLNAEPNSGNAYAFYGYVLWQQRKLVRAEAYYRRATSFPNGNDLASVGLRDIARVRAQSETPAYVERFGDPLDDYDLEPPSAEDVARGVGEVQ